jgi:Ser/Thr protein kinase RdoA (MazF antagonist)
LSSRRARDEEFLRRIAGSFLAGADSVREIRRARGGFSGTPVFKVQADSGQYALRNWHGSDVPLERIQELHRWLAHLQQCGIPVAVPLRQPLGGESLLAREDSFWQLEPWLPGTPIESGSPADTIAATMEVVAKMHLAARHYQPTPAGSAWFASKQGTPPAVFERIQHILYWTPQRLLQAQQQISTAPDWLRFPAAEILANFAVRGGLILRELREVEAIDVPLHPCFRDLWCGHVLIANGCVTGLIDAAAARMDHACSDLSRLLGSLYEDDFDRWKEALQIYEQRRPLAAREYRLLRVLDRSSVLLSGTTWINRWLNHELSDGRDQQLRERIASIARRVQRLDQNNLL